MQSFVRSLQVTYYVYMVLLFAILATVAMHFASLAYLLQSTSLCRLLQCFCSISTVLVCTRGFHARHIYAGLCVALAAASAILAPKGMGAAYTFAGALLALTGGFTWLPVHKKPSLALVVVPCFVWEWLLLFASQTTAASALHMGGAARMETCQAGHDREHTRSQASAEKLASGQPQTTVNEHASDDADKGTSSVGMNGTKGVGRGNGTVFAAQAAALGVTAVIICSTSRETELSSAPAEGFALSAIEQLVQHFDTALTSATGPLRPFLEATKHVPGLQGTSVAQLVLRSLFVAFPLIALQCRKSQVKLLRLLAVLVGFSGPFAILSTAWEGLFLLAFSATLLMYTWLAECFVLDSSHGRTAQQGVAHIAGSSGSAVHAAQAHLHVSSTSTSKTGPASTHALGLGGSTRMRMQTHASLQTAQSHGESRKEIKQAIQGNKGGHACRTDAAKHSPLRMPESRHTEGSTMVYMWAATVTIVGVNLAFFGTGNMASVASFEPASVLRLMTCAVKAP
jgi:hypothetical protein